MTSETQMNILNRMDTLSELDSERPNYQREFNGFKPKFKGKAQGYYPNTCRTYITVLLILQPAYIVCALGLWLQIWLATSYSVIFSYVCFGLLCAYVAVCTIVVYCGAFGRLKMERECLAARRQEQLARQRMKKEEREQAEKLLREYNSK